MRIVVGYAGTLTQWLTSGEVDAALIYGAQQAAEIQATPLLEDPLWVIGSAQSALRGRSAPAGSATRDSGGRMAAGAVAGASSGGRHVMR